MNIDTIIGMLDAFKQVSYELGYVNSNIDTIVEHGYISENEKAELYELAEKSEGKEDLINDIREKIITALYQLTSPTLTSTIEDVDLDN